MFIPQTNSPNPDASVAPAARLGVGLASAHKFIRYHTLPFLNSLSSQGRRLLAHNLDAFAATFSQAPGLRKRSGGGNVNTTIGVVVGVLLAVFLAGFFAFLYMYGRSIRVTRRKHRRRKSSASKNSEAAGAGGGGDPPPPT